MSRSGGAIEARRSRCASLSSPASLTKRVSSGCGALAAGTTVATARSVVGTSGIGSDLGFSLGDVGGGIRVVVAVMGGAAFVGSQLRGDGMDQVARGEDA